MNQYLISDRACLALPLDFARSRFAFALDRARSFRMLLLRRVAFFCLSRFGPPRTDRTARFLDWEGSFQTSRIAGRQP